MSAQRLVGPPKCNGGVNYYCTTTKLTARACMECYLPMEWHVCRKRKHVHSSVPNVCQSHHSCTITSTCEKVLANFRFPVDFRCRPLLIMHGSVSLLFAETRICFLSFFIHLSRMEGQVGDCGVSHEARARQPVLQKHKQKKEKRIRAQTWWVDASRSGDGRAESIYFLPQEESDFLLQELNERTFSSGVSFSNATAAVTNEPTLRMNVMALLFSACVRAPAT